MGRAKREMKKIENATRRHVTFSKRRAGLFKKARELSILCDATVALFTFSSTGELFEFCSSNMQSTIERYSKYPEDPESLISSTSNNVKNTELIIMNERYENLSQKCRQMRGKELEGIELKELEGLEDGLEQGLKCIRSKQNEVYIMQMEECHQKGKEVSEENSQFQAQAKMRQTQVEDYETPWHCRNLRSNDESHGREGDGEEDQISLHL